MVLDSHKWSKLAITGNFFAGFSEILKFLTFLLLTRSLTLTRPRGAFAPKNKMRTPYSTSQNSDLNQTSFLGKIRPKSDQK